MQITSQQVYDCIHYLLVGQSNESDQMIHSDNTIYTFFEIESKPIKYILMKNTDKNYFYLSVISQDYTDTINLLVLADYSIEKSQIFWDILEMGGIKNYSFQLLLKSGIPNNQELKDIDWDEVQI